MAPRQRMSAFLAGPGAALIRPQTVHYGSRIVPICSLSSADTSARPILLAPGQGAQYAGMLRDHFSVPGIVSDTLTEADTILGDALGAPLSQIIRNGTSAELAETSVAQPAIFAVSVASLRLACESGALPAAPSSLLASAGLSLGEYTALHAAGALSFADGLRLVAERGAAMAEAAASSAGGMLALIGATPEVASEVVEIARGADVLVAANFNAPGQIVLSGSVNAIGRAEEDASKRGLRAVKLDVAGAFHSPLMEPAAERLMRVLEKAQIESLKTTVLCGVTGKPHTEEDIRKRLAEGLTSAVRWEECVRFMMDMPGASDWIELAPGKTLAGMVRKINRRTRVESLDAPKKVASGS